MLYESLPLSALLFVWFLGVFVPPLAWVISVYLPRLSVSSSWRRGPPVVAVPIDIGMFPSDKIKGVLVGYDDDQGPLLARIYFPDTNIFELHDNGDIQDQSFKDQITGVDEPEEEPRDDHPVEFYAPLVGTRHMTRRMDIKIPPN